MKNYTSTQENKNKGNAARIQFTLNERYGLNIVVDNIYGKNTFNKLFR